MAVGLLGHAYARSGLTKQANELVAELTARSDTEYVASFCFLAIYVGLDDKENICHCLARTQEEGFSPVFVWAGLKPDLDSLSSKHGFQNLLSQIYLEPSS